jgi:trehalose 6-phosphate synthase/phosphatase
LRDRRNFVQCVRTLMKDVTVQGKGQALTMLINESKLGRNHGYGVHATREIRVCAFPISIDFSTYAEQSASSEVSKLSHVFHDNLHGRQMIFGCDRLDYTKGIPNRLEAFRNALSRFPELRQKVTLIQQVIPSREDIREYQNLRLQIEHLISEINGEFTESGWVPIHYIFRHLSLSELLAYYRAAEIALITPLKDGMNLVAKEYCAAQVEENGVLILSEFAGAAAQLQKGALLVNPHDIEGVADRIYEAFQMNPEERRLRMRRLRRSIREFDIFWWVDSFLRAAIEKNLRDFPIVEEYIPETKSAPFF